MEHNKKWEKTKRRKKSYDQQTEDSPRPNKKGEGGRQKIKRRTKSKERCRRNRLDNSERKVAKEIFFIYKSQSTLEISLLNIQGLTQHKQAEIEENITSNTIMCITETQHKYLKVNISDNISHVHSHRDKDDRKGGGLSIMMKKNDSKAIEKLNSGHKDILYARLKIEQFTFKMLLIYMSVNDSNRNNIIQSKINAILHTNENEPIILLGDFNGHVGFLGPQEINKNGEKVIQWITDPNLMLLNADPQCSGEITWESRGLKSSIDFILVNQHMYRKFCNMKIDEEKTIYDLSDHNLLSAYFNIQTHKQIYKNEKKVITYLKINEDTVSNYRAHIENALIETENYNDLHNLEILMKEASENFLNRQIKRRINQNTESIEPVWITPEIKKEISKRRKYNKELRKVQDPTEKERRFEMYKSQKTKVKLMVKNAISKNEKKILQRALKKDKTEMQNCGIT